MGFYLGLNISIYFKIAPHPDPLNKFLINYVKITEFFLILSYFFFC